MIGYAKIALGAVVVAAVALLAAAGCAEAPATGSGEQSGSIRPPDWLKGVVWVCDRSTYEMRLACGDLIGEPTTVYFTSTEVRRGDPAGDNAAWIGVASPYTVSQSASTSVYTIRYTSSTQNITRTYRRTPTGFDFEVKWEGVLSATRSASFIRRR